MIILDLNYFSLLSRNPINLHGIGSVISPKLSEIEEIGVNNYNSFLSLLLMDKDRYYKIMDDDIDSYFQGYKNNEREFILSRKNEYQSFSSEVQKSIHFFNIMIYDPSFRNALCEALNFFLVDDVVFDESAMSYNTYDGTIDKDESKIITGQINYKTYEIITDVILQRNYLNVKKAKRGKIKNRKTAELMDKLNDEEDDSISTIDRKMELGNIISSMAIHSEGINILNIWDMTIYQLYDQFTRQKIDDHYDINQRSVSIWGSGSNTFDDSLWLSVINNK